VIYVMFIKNITDMMARKLETNSLLMEAVFVLVLVFLLRPLERRMEEFMDRYFTGSGIYSAINFSSLPGGW